MNIFKIFVGSFFKPKKNGEVIVSIANSSPAHVKEMIRNGRAFEYRKLFPGWDLLNAYKAGLSEAEYVIRYKAMLSTLDKDTVLREITALAPGKNIVLCCWEPKGKFCHRQIVAEWLGLQEE